MSGAGKAAGSSWPPSRPPSRSMRWSSPSGSPHRQQPARMEERPPASRDPGRHSTPLRPSGSHESWPTNRPRGPNCPTRRPSRQRRNRPKSRWKTRRHRSPMIRGPLPASRRENRRPRADLCSREPRDRSPQPGSSPGSRTPRFGGESGTSVAIRGRRALLACAAASTLKERDIRRVTPGRSTRGRLRTRPDGSGAPRRA